MRPSFPKLHDAFHKTYGSRNYSYCEPEVKRSLHKSAQAYLRQLAHCLDILPGEFDLRSNMGGIAGSGEITLHSDELYVQVQQSCMSREDELMFLIRGVKGRKDYCGLTNHHVTLQRGNSVEVLRVCLAALEDKKRWADVNKVEA